MCHEFGKIQKIRDEFFSDIFRPAPLAIIRVSETGQRLRGASSSKTVHTPTYTQITRHGSKLRTRHEDQRRTEKDKETKSAYEKEGKEHLTKKQTHMQTYALQVHSKGTGIDMHSNKHKGKGVERRK